MRTVVSESTFLVQTVQHAVVKHLIHLITLCFRQHSREHTALNDAVVKLGISV